MPFSARLKAALDTADKTQRDLAKHLNVAESTVSQWVTGKRLPDLPTVARLAAYLRVSVGSLVNESKTSYTRTEETLHGKRPISLPIVQFGKGVRSVLSIAAKPLPILGRIRAGIPLLSEEHIVGQIEVPETIASQAEFALEVEGDSMIGTGLQTGDYVFMRTAARRPPAHGDVVAAMVDGEMTLKRYVKRDGSFWLHAENPNYADIPVDNRVVIQGVCVGRFSEFSGTVDPPADELTEEELITKLALKRGIDPDQVSGMLDVLSHKKR